MRRQIESSTSKPVRAATRAESPTTASVANDGQMATSTMMAAVPTLKQTVAPRTRWSSVSVLRTAVEVGGTVSMKSYPKSQAGCRVVLLPDFVVELVRDHLAAFPLGARGEVFTSPSVGSLYRGTFRAYT